MQNLFLCPSVFILVFLRKHDIIKEKIPVYTEGLMNKEMYSAFSSCFSHPATHLFSAPGRTELSGNHTDHQHGCVLAAAVDLDTVAAVALNGLNVIRVQSEGYPLCQIDLNDLSVHDEEKNTTAALIRGVAARFAQLGAQVQGFDAYVTSTVLPGSGLSSSAAFEVLLGTIINHLFFDAKATAVEVAQIGQYAENVYFGKPCGLMDQTASSVGSIITIDFQDPANPIVEKLDFADNGYAICILDSGADHADLTDEYADIPQEMKAVAAYFGKDVLRDVDEADFYAKLAAVRESCGDRAVLRTIHFFEENRRIQKQVCALKNNDFEEFLQYVRESGRSSQLYLQNITPAGRTDRQEMAVTLALAEKLLGGRGACRVHGGGFAGTALAFVPRDMLDTFCAAMEAILGKGACHVLNIREQGGVLLEVRK